MVETTYRKAPSFAAVFPVVERLIRRETDSLPEYLAHQLRTLCCIHGDRHRMGDSTSRRYEQ